MAANMLMLQLVKKGLEVARITELLGTSRQEADALGIFT